MLAPSRSGNTPKKGTHSLKQNSNEWPINVIMTTIQGSDAPVYIALVWKADYIRHTKRQLPSSSYNHNTLATVRASVMLEEGSHKRIVRTTNVCNVLVPEDLLQAYSARH